MPTPVVAFADIGDTLRTEDMANAACRAHDMLRRDHIVLVLCSSRTRAELEVCQQLLGIAHPFICESGAAVLIPHRFFSFDVPCDRDLAGHHVIEYGKPYREVVETLHRTAQRLGIGVVGFSDMSTEQVATECDLSLPQARLAKLREYDEPFRVADADDAARDRLLKALSTSRLTCTHRGTYDHVGAGADKGACAGLLTALFRRAFGPVISVGLGDVTNSAALLRRVKVPVVVESEDIMSRPRLLPRVPRVRLTAEVETWIDAIAAISRQARERKMLRRAG